MGGDGERKYCQFYPKTFLSPQCSSRCGEAEWISHSWNLLSLTHPHVLILLLSPSSSHSFPRVRHKLGWGKGKKVLEDSLVEWSHMGHNLNRTDCVAFGYISNFRLWNWTGSKGLLTLASLIKEERSHPPLFWHPVVGVARVKVHKWSRASSIQFVSEWV